MAELRSRERSPETQRRSTDGTDGAQRETAGDAWSPEESRFSVSFPLTPKRCWESPASFAARLSQRWIKSSVTHFQNAPFASLCSARQNKPAEAFAASFCHVKSSI